MKKHSQIAKYYSKYYLLPVFIVYVLSVSEMYGVNIFAANSYNDRISEVTDDSIITAKIKSQLATNEITRMVTITVETNNGIVYLSGVVNSQEQITKIIQLANDVYGVKEVISKIKVK